jgi:hypothetical protein
MLPNPLHVQHYIAMCGTPAYTPSREPMMFNLHISKILVSAICVVGLTVPQCSVEGAWAADAVVKASDSATSSAANTAVTSPDSANPTTVDLTKVMTESATTASPKSGSGNPTSTRLFREEIRKFASPALEQEIDRLVDEAVVQAATSKLIAEKERHYNNPVHVIVASGKDIAELATSYRGFEQSSEAADVVLEEKVKLKSRASVAYSKQHQKDMVHAKVVAAMMQIAMARGLKDPSESSAAETEAVAQLSTLVGAEQTTKTVQLVNDWCEHCQESVTADTQPIVGPLKLKAESDKIMRHAMASDEVVGEIKHKLHKYNGRSNLARATAKIVNTSLSIAAFTPTFISPAAQVAWCAYIVTQGGPEESKLLKEVYLAKRFESRWQMLNEEANLALNSYNTGIYTHNTPLLAFSQFLIGHMGEPEPVSSDSGVAKTEASGPVVPVTVDLAKSGTDQPPNQ